MEIQETTPKDWGTNCADCSRYKTLGEVCVIEHGKKFLWEFCRDFQPDVQLPEYDELMRTVKKEMAVEREKARQKKKRGRALRRKDKEERQGGRKRAAHIVSGESKASTKIQIESSQTRRVNLGSSIRPLHRVPASKLVKPEADINSSEKPPKFERRAPPAKMAQAIENNASIPSTKRKHPRNVAETRQEVEGKETLRVQAKTPRTASSARATA